MSCPDSNSPIDISSSNVSGTCDLKCDYKFKYQNSSCVGKNVGNYISLSYDNSSSTITYNQIYYYVKEVRIYTPSLHSFNGNKTDGELVIVHESNTGESPLLVCIPIKVSSNANAMLANIIATMARNAPSEGDSTTIKMNDYNLSRIIPKKGFYSYTATEPYQPCTSTVNFIVFDVNDGSVDMSSDMRKKLQSIIKENNYTIKSDVPYFYNSKGANTISADDIYIDCQPVGESEETTEVINDTGYDVDSEYTWDSLKDNEAFKTLISVLIFIVIIFIFTGIIKAFQMFKTMSGNVT